MGGTIQGMGLGFHTRFSLQGVSGALRCVTLMRCAVLRWCVTTVGYGAGHYVRVTLCGLRCAGTVCVCVYGGGFAATADAMQ